MSGINNKEEGKKMKVTFENYTAVETKGVIENAGAMQTLDGAYNYLKTWLYPKIFFIYRGGHHIAIHRINQQTKEAFKFRTAIITE